jgi:hypothetical protein
VSATIRAPANFVMQESAQSPIFKPVFIMATGKEPYYREDFSFGSAGVDEGDPLVPRARAKAALLNATPLIQSLYVQHKIGEKGFDIYLQAVLDMFTSGGRLVDMDVNDDAAMIKGKIATTETAAEGVAKELFLLPESERRKHYEDRLKHVTPALRPVFSREVAKHLAGKFYGYAEDTKQLGDTKSMRKTYQLFDHLKEYEKAAQEITDNQKLSPVQKKDLYLKNDAELDARMKDFFDTLDKLNPPPDPKELTGNPFTDLGRLLERLAPGPPAT